MTGCVFFYLKQNLYFTKSTFIVDILKIQKKEREIDIAQIFVLCVEDFSNE